MDEEVEPDPETARLTDQLLEAFWTNKPDDAIAALRSMASMDGFELPTELLIPYFRESSQKSRLFPRRIGFKKRSRGRPKAALPSLGEFGLGAATPFFEAIATRDTKRVQQELSNLNCLAGKHLQLLADLLDLNADPPAVFAWRLEIQAKRVGRPAEVVTLSSNKVVLARVLRDAVEKFPAAGEKEAAIQHVTTQTGMGRSAVAEAMDRLGIRSPSWKIRN